ncbi:hypothetical protein [Arsenicicoccus dermatophilus]|uniref:hypothetical protein n=1 Tax=Arsenicicoccus dermatophilus TaxID=1076331 RepID=UPI0039174AE0
MTSGPGREPADLQPFGREPLGAMGLLARAAAEVDRLTPLAAAAGQHAGALPGDVRTDAHRGRLGSCRGRSRST